MSYRHHSDVNKAIYLKAKVTTHKSKAIGYKAKALDIKAKALNE
jgi:hypothetical protein